MFMTELEKLGEQHKVLRPWTEIGLRWATKYYIRMDDTDVYVIAMCKILVILLLCRQLRLTVLNPAIRLSWIRSQWETRYIQRSEEIILDLVSTIYRYSPYLNYLIQMRRYRDQNSSTLATPVQPTPVAGGRPPPTRFKVEHSVYEKKATPQAYTVEAEFRKYVSGAISSEETDILQFWEVGLL
jgi:hypothetical protein